MNSPILQVFEFECGVGMEPATIYVQLIQKIVLQKSQTFNVERARDDG